MNAKSSGCFQVQESKTPSSAGQDVEQQSRDAASDLLQFVQASVPPRDQTGLVYRLCLGPLSCDDCGECCLCNYSASPEKADTKVAHLDLLRQALLTNPVHSVRTLSSHIAEEWRETVAHRLRLALFERVSVGDYLLASLPSTYAPKSQDALLRVVNKTKTLDSHGCFGLEAQLVCFRHSIPVEWLGYSRLPIAPEGVSVCLVRQREDARRLRENTAFFCFLFRTPSSQCDRIYADLDSTGAMSREWLFSLRVHSAADTLPFRNAVPAKFWLHPRRGRLKRVLGRQARLPRELVELCADYVSMPLDRAVAEHEAVPDSPAWRQVLLQMGSHASAVHVPVRANRLLWPGPEDGPGTSVLEHVRDTFPEDEDWFRVRKRLETPVAEAAQHALCLWDAIATSSS